MKIGVISLSREQYDRLDIINKANAGYLTVKESSEQLGISNKPLSMKGAASYAFENVSLFQTIFCVTFIMRFNH